MATLDSGLLFDAARRYKERVPVRSTESGNLAAPKPSERSAYLSRNLSKDRAQLMSTDATAKGAPQRPDETVRQIASERIIGSSDLVDFNFLELAIAMGRAVARIKIGNGLATGVLVGPGLIMTNHHVIESAADASIALAQFDYQENAQHELLPVHQFRLNPARLFLTDNALDFTVVALEPVSDKGKSISEYPWVPLIGQTGKAETGDPINIIQHPRGGLKQISFRENRVIEIPRETKDFLYYTTDTEPGSSGSPCFNDQWELIALHHSGVPDTDTNGAVLKHDKTVWRKDIDPEALIEWIANEGGRISAIVAVLQSAPLQNEAADLRNQMLGAKAPNPVELARKNFDASSSLSPVPPTAVSPGPSKSEHQGVTPTMSQSVTLTVPLQITFSIGNAAAVEPTAAASPSLHCGRRTLAEPRKSP